MNPFRILIESLRYAKRVHDGKPVISTVYPIRMVPRWQGGSGIPQISRIFEKSEDRIKRNLAELAEFKRVVEEIELGRKEFSIEWRSMMPVLDGLSIMWAAANTGRRFVEIGSGTSTRYARAALGEKADPALLISIDPEPRREINTICDQVIRKPLEETDLGLFEELEPGDTVFVDNSHQSFMNSDVTAVMIDVVPRISAGVLIGFHDVFYLLIIHSRGALAVIMSSTCSHVSFFQIPITFKSSLQTHTLHQSSIIVAHWQACGTSWETMSSNEVDRQFGCARTERTGVISEDGINSDPIDPVIVITPFKRRRLVII